MILLIFVLIDVKYLLFLQLSTQGATFCESQAVMLLHEAFAVWAQEHLTAASTDRDSSAKADPESAATESPLPPYLAGSAAAFKYLRKRTAKAAAGAVNKTGDDCADANCPETESKSETAPATAESECKGKTTKGVDGIEAVSTEARSIGLSALAHVRKQMISILSELYAAGAEAHDVRNCCPATAHNHLCSGKNAQLQQNSDDINDDDSEDKDDYDDVVYGTEGKPPACVNKSRRGMSMMAGYVPLAKCGELYGLDFMVDERLKVWLLEVNAGPDFGQTGQRLKELVCRPLVQGAVQLALGTVLATEPRNSSNCNVVIDHASASAENSGKGVGVAAAARPSYGRDDSTPIELIREVTVGNSSSNGVAGAADKGMKDAEAVVLRDDYAEEAMQIWGLPAVPHFTPVLHIVL